MTAETLRRAAALMRERAEAASPAPWRAEPGSTGRQASGEPWPSLYVAHASNVPRFRTHSEADAEHIASWHPAVARAVADWLDSVREQIQGDIWPFDAHEPWIQHPLTVARAYLGETA